MFWYIFFKFYIFSSDKTEEQMLCNGNIDNKRAKTQSIYSLVVISISVQDSCISACPWSTTEIVRSCDLQEWQMGHKSRKWEDYESEEGIKKETTSILVKTLQITTTHFMNPLPGWKMMLIKQNVQLQVFLSYSIVFKYWVKAGGVVQVSKTLTTWLMMNIHNIENTRHLVVRLSARANLSSSHTSPPMTKISFL